MSRCRTKAEDIKNREHYFNRYIAMEVRHDQEEQDVYNNMFASLDELQEGGEKGLSQKACKMLAAGSEENNLEEMLCSTSLLSWIDYVENPKLYEGLRSLTTEQQIFVTLRFRLCYTQDEIAAVYQIKQQNVSRREARIIKKLKKFANCNNKLDTPW